MHVIIKKLIWDEWNITHIRKHDVLPDMVEEICRINSQVESASKGRIRLTGLTNKGRIVSIFLDPETESGVYYPVSARDASKKERLSYINWIKGGDESL